MTIFREIRAGPREWWYHKQLRDQGQHDKARKLEHQSARSTVKSIRLAIQNGGFLTLGRGGYTLHYGDYETPGGLKYSNCTIQGHGCDTSRTVKAAILAGILTIDSRTIPDERIFDTVHMPIGKPGLEAREPFLEGSESEWLDYIPPPELARRYAELGATVHNQEDK